MRVRRHAPGELPAICSATVANPDLANFTVLIDAFDGDERQRQEWEIVHVALQPDAAPARGDRCLTVADELGRRSVVVGTWTGTP